MKKIRRNEGTQEIEKRSKTIRGQVFEIQENNWKSRKINNKESRKMRGIGWRKRGIKLGINKG